MVRCALVGFVVVLACTARERSDSSSRRAHAVVLEGEAPRRSPGPLRVPQPESTLIVYAGLVSQPAEVPARYAAPLPGELEAADGDWAESTPPEIVGARVCRGDARSQAAVVTALETAAARGATEDELTEVYAEKLGLVCSTPSFCAWARDVSRSGRSPAVREFFWFQLRECHDPATREHFARRDAPVMPLLVWMDWGEPEDRDARLVPALRKLARTSATDPHPVLVEWVQRLASEDEVASVRTATKLYAEIHDPRARALLLRAFARNPAPLAQSFFAKHCTDVDPPDCEVDLDIRPPTPGPADDLAAYVRTSADVVSLWREFPAQRTDIESALTDCALDPIDAELTANDCLIQLARIDREIATAVAGALLRDPEHEDARGLATLLQRFPSLSALDDHLDELGLVRRPDSMPDPTAIALLDVLVARGRAVAFDAESDEFPIRHHVLLDELASLMAPDLDGVVFDQRAPRVDADGEKLDPDEGYTLIAYMDGQRHEVAAGDFSRWYDMSATYGLLNALARERGAATRVMGTTTDFSLAAIAGPAPALEALVAAKLVHP